MKIGVLVLLVVSHIHLLLASPSTAPAFLWSPHLQSENNQLDEAVNYQIISPKDLANSVLSQGGWSNILCSKKELQHPVDLALVYIGRELLYLDDSLNRNEEPTVLNLLKGFYTTSNFSVAFPYISTSEEERMENLLVSGFKETCGRTFGVSNVVLSDSCAVHGDIVQKLANLQLIQEANKERGGNRFSCLLLWKLSTFKQADKPRSESELRVHGEIISELISSVEQSGTKYAALYVSDPYLDSSYHTLQRFLAESAAGKGSAGATAGCDEVCRLKSLLLEGVLVGIVFRS